MIIITDLWLFEKSMEWVYIYKTTSHPRPPCFGSYAKAQHIEEKNMEPRKKKSSTNALITSSCINMQILNSCNLRTKISVKKTKWKRIELGTEEA